MEGPAIDTTVLLDDGLLVELVNHPTAPGAAKALSHFVSP
jgi:hypothetical protein